MTRRIRSALCEPLSPGQTDRQVVASGLKLNLRTDLQVAKKNVKAVYPNYRLMNVAQLAFTWVGWPNGETLVLSCVQI